MNETTKPYGRCNDCGTEVSNADELKAHLDSTFVGVKSHSVRRLNYTKAERAKQRVTSLVEDAIQSCIEELLDLVDDGDLSADDVADELKWFGDFHDAWKEAHE